MIAALYVESGGCYWGIDGVDAWDIERDARNYRGPWPVVAHPPCNKWSPLAYINQKRLPNYHIGDDGGCFAYALGAVREFGGVLEHPALSIAWGRFGLQKPARGSWQACPDGWVTEVDQGTYGHRARKRTWLLYVGIREPHPLDWTPARADASVSGFRHHARGSYVPDEGRRIRPKEAAATPPAFRDLLIGLARGCQ